MEANTFDKTEKRERLQKLVLGFKSMKGKTWAYAFGHTFTEILNWVNVILQFVLTHFFLQGKFFTYGKRVYSYWTEEEDLKNSIWDPMDDIFPKAAKCEFFNYGVGGGVQNGDFMCVLALNDANDKIYLALWPWYIFLFFMTTAALVYRFVCWFSPELRTVLLWKTHQDRGMMSRVCRENSKVGICHDEMNNQKIINYI